MAEYRVKVLYFSPSLPILMIPLQAAEDALHRVYLTRTPTHLLQLPSSTFPSERGNIFQVGREEEYTAGPLGEVEVRYASSGRSHIVAPQRNTRMDDDNRQRDSRKGEDI